MLRPGRVEDGLGIAEVYLASWRSAESDLVRRASGEKDQSRREQQDSVDSKALREQTERFTKFLQTKQRLFVVAQVEPGAAQTCEGSASIGGFISYGRSYTRDGFGEVMQLFVHPRWQRQGLGTRLLREAWRCMCSEEWAASGCHVWCTKGNPANRVYEQVGWASTGKEKRIAPTLSKDEVEVEEFEAPRAPLGGSKSCIEKLGFFSAALAMAAFAALIARQGYECTGMLLFDGGSSMLGHSTDASLVRVEPGEEESDARCLDGSPPAYYLQRGSGSSSRSWLLYFQGGGWCVPQGESPPGFPESLIDACKVRASRALGSTRHDADKEDLSIKQLFCRDPSLNPAFFNWNVAKIRYCDGSSFADRAGHANFRAVLRSLLNAGLAGAEAVVVSGCSAGAVAAALHVGAVRQAVPQASLVAGLLDSGTFPDWSRSEPSGTAGAPPAAWPMDAELRRAVAGGDYLRAGALPASCLRSHSEEPWRCLFLEHLLPFVEVPCFVLQSRFDSSLIRSLEPGQGIELVGDAIAWRLHAALNRSEADHALFLDSCFHHCRSWGEISGRLSSLASEQTQPEAFLMWWQSLLQAGGKRNLRWEHVCPASLHSGGPCWDETSCTQTSQELDFWNRTFTPHHGT
eukprot:TRINITY_DN35389_c0_g1_i1.p1 TRINITY_DN35389_c0_g1~~TRINITY_DN35389_c0_g1_i1.p1  ORF type:complete len:631 (-),score=137.02 TRINITY_DN35389_c0_g1_i1:64-1956(-)